MATYEELLRAAKKADAAGNTEAVREILGAAKAMRASASGPVQTSAGPIPRVDAPRSEPPKRQLDRFGDTISAAVEGPLEATKQYAAQSQDRSRSRLERAGDYAMTGLNALGTAYSFGAGLAGETFGGSPTGERKLARDLMMAGAVAVPELAGVSSVTRAAGSAGRAANRKTPAPESALEAGKRAADDLGVTPSLGAGGKVRAMTAAGLEKLPLAGGIIGRDAARFVDDVETVAAAAKGRVGSPAVPSEAGDMLQRGLKGYVDRGKERAESLFAKVGEALPPETRVPLDRTIAAMDEARVIFRNNPELAKRLGVTSWDNVLDEANQNGIGWDAVRMLRSEIGEAIGSNRGSLAEESVGRLKRLYGALSEDMEAAALSAGPDAKKAWQAANNHYKKFATRVERYLDKTISANSPERAFEAFANMARADSGTADVQRMRQIKASLKPGEWRDISASIVERLGKPTAGAQGADDAGFSPNRFLRQWNDMSDEAKKLLLPEETRIELQKVARLAEMIKGGNLERNFSNTGTPAGLGAILLGSTVSLPKTVAAVGGATIGAAAMTSKPFLRALNRAGRGDLKQMKALADSKSPLAEDARTVLQIMGAETAAQGGANQNNPLRIAQ